MTVVNIDTDYDGHTDSASAGSTTDTTALVSQQYVFVQHRAFFRFPTATPLAAATGINDVDLQWNVTFEDIEAGEGVNIQRYNNTGTDDPEADDAAEATRYARCAGGTTLASVDCSSTGSKTADLAIDSEILSSISSPGFFALAMNHWNIDNSERIEIETLENAGSSHAKLIVDYVDVVEVGVAGAKGAPSGTLASLFVDLLAGAKGAPSGAFSLIRYFVDLAGAKGAPSGAVTGVLTLEAAVEGLKGAPSGDVTWRFVATVEGLKGAPSGAITAINYAVAVAGAKGAPSGDVDVLYYIPLAGAKGAPSGALSLIKYLITLSGTKGAPSGVLVVRLVPRLLTARAYLHNPWWPRERTAELLTASDIDRSWQQMAVGKASLTIARTEPQLSSDVLYEGAILVIESPGMPAWAGYISQVTEDLESGRIDIGAVEMTSALNAKAVRLGASFNTASGLVVQSMVAAANARADTGVRLPAGLEMGPAVEDYAPGAQSVLSALKQLHERTGFEWWMEAAVQPSGVEALLYWGDRQGEDVADDLHLYEGIHFSVLEYTLATAGIRQAVQVVGGVDDVRSRQSVIRHAAGVPGLGGRTDPASEGYSRTFSQRPAALHTEAVVLDPTTTDPNALARRARRELERPRGAGEGLTIVVNRRVDWRMLRVGNYITVTASSLGLGQVTRVVRIVGLQPDEDAGECEVEVEVPL